MPAKNHGSFPASRLVIPVLINELPSKCLKFFQIYLPNFSQ